MSGPLPDNALLAWLQDDSNDDFRSTEALTTMYGFFATGAANPLERLQEENPHHLYLIFIEDEQKEVTGVILHHLALFPSSLGVSTTGGRKKFDFLRNSTNMTLKKLNTIFSVHSNSTSRVVIYSER